MVKVQPWILYSKHLVMCLKVVIDMVQPWVFHDGVLPRDAFD